MHKGKNKYVQAHSNASIVKYKLSSTNSQVQNLTNTKPTDIFNYRNANLM